MYSALHGRMRLDDAKFCEFFQLGDGGHTEEDSLRQAREAADALFRPS